MPLPARAQALLPHILQPDFGALQEQGLTLAQQAVQLSQFHQFNQALSRAQLATQLAPQVPQVWSLLGSLYLEANNLDQGVAALKHSLALQPKDAQVLFLLGSTYFEQKHYNQAAATLEAGLQLDPKSPGALFDLGNTFYAQQKYDQAIAQYQKAVQQEANFWPALNNIGLVEYEKGEVSLAMQHWLAASAIDAKATEPRLALAVALFTQGHRDQAIARGITALKLDPRYGSLKYLKENLWGSRLLQDAQTFLQLPQIQAAIATAQANQPTDNDSQ